MIPASIPGDEQERLSALLELRILDTPAEERFDRITRIARHLFGVPIALISLVDARRQWFKSASGLEVRETPREVSFCGHAILGSGALVIEDALRDPRFADNPLVTGAPGVRFYAGFPLRSREGRALGTLCLVDHAPRGFAEADVLRLRDLAAWAETELARHDEIASLTAEMREGFLRLVNHELRTPVTGVVGAIELLRGGIATGAEIEELGRIAAEAASKLSRSVDDILELTSLDAGELPPAAQNLALAPLIDQVLAAGAERAAQGGIGMRAHVPSGLRVQAVPSWLHRILGNLLDNALQFSPSGTNVLISAEATDADRVRISVADAGPGISRDYLPRLFSAFSQADTGDSRRHGGLGLGLAISQRFAVAMGGRLGYESDAAGRRFVLSLPRAEPAGPE